MARTVTKTPKREGSKPKKVKLSSHIKEYIDLLGLVTGILAFVVAFLWGGVFYGVGCTAFYATYYILLRQIAKKRSLLTQKDSMYVQEKEILTKLGNLSLHRLRKLVDIVYWISLGLTIPFLYRLDTDMLNTLHVYHMITLLLLTTFYIFPEGLIVSNLFDVFIRKPLSVVFSIVTHLKPTINFVFKKQNKLRKVVIITFVVIVSISLSFILTYILSKTDEAFHLKVKWFLESDFIATVIWRGFIFVISVFFIGAIFIDTLVKYSERFRSFTKKDEVDKFITKVKSYRVYSDFVASLPVIFNIPILFTYYLYSYFQLTYLFKGRQLITEVGKYTYAGYVRRGAMELFIVTIIAFLITLTSIRFAKTKNKLIRNLNIGVIVATLGAIGVMLVSIIKRMILYIDVYGITEFRIYFVLAIGVFSVMLIAWAILAIKKLMSLDFKLVYAKVLGDSFWLFIFSIVIFVAIITVVPINSLVVKDFYNRYKAGKTVSTHYLIYKSAVEQDPVIYDIAKLAKERGDDELYTIIVGKILQDETLLDYNDKKGSIFSLVGHLNITRLRLKSLAKQVKEESGLNTLDDVDKHLESIVKTKVQSYVNEINRALENNQDLAPIAEKYWDPKLHKFSKFKIKPQNTEYKCKVKLIDLDKHVDTTDYDRDDYYYGKKISFGSARLYEPRSSVEILNDRDSYDYRFTGGDYFSIPYRLNCTTLSGDSYAGFGEVKLGFRGGKLYVIDDRYFPLAYLGDKVISTGISDSVWYAYNRCNPSLTTCASLEKNRGTNSYYYGSQNYHPHYLDFASYKFFDIKDE